MIDIALNHRAALDAATALCLNIEGPRHGTNERGC